VSVLSSYYYYFFVLWIIPDGLLLLVKTIEQLEKCGVTCTHEHMHAQGGFCPKS